MRWAHDLYAYGDERITDSTVAVFAGGGNSIDVLQELQQNGVNTLVTGITVRNNFSEMAHRYAEEHRINLLGATHYSTEKYACIAMTTYFEGMGLSSELIADAPMMDDL